MEGPVYRVYFWHRPVAPIGVAQEHMMSHSDEYRLSGAVDVGEVLDWARTTARPTRPSLSMSSMSSTDMATARA